MALRTGHIVLAAGGTGGHLFPAAAVAAELTRRGHSVTLFTDARGMRFADIFGDLKVVKVPAGRFTESSIAHKLGVATRMAKGLGTTRNLLKAEKPDAVIGFGGYATLPALLAAISLGIPCCLHEQNAVLGRVNRWLAGWVDAVAISYPKTRFLTGSKKRKAVVTGNPVRPEIAAIADLPYPEMNGEGIIRILVIGGSQGASVLSDVVPPALATLPPAVRQRLQVTQQCRPEDITRTEAAYQDSGIAADVAEFVADMPERLAWAHLVIGRAGASTLAEVAAAGRPAILVPLPSAMDDHQTDNARVMAEAGAGWLVPQAEFTAADLAKRIQKLINRPETLADAAQAAKSVGRPGAARAVSDLVQKLARLGGERTAEDSAAPQESPDPNALQRRAA